MDSKVIQAKDLKSEMVFHTLFSNIEYKIIDVVESRGRDHHLRSIRIYFEDSERVDSIVALPNDEFLIR